MRSFFSARFVQSGKVKVASIVPSNTKVSSKISDRERKLPKIPGTTLAHLPLFSRKRALKNDRTRSALFYGTFATQLITGHELPASTYSYVNKHSWLGMDESRRF